MKPQKKCKNCGNYFEKRRQSKNNYCSRSCYYEHKRLTSMVTIDVCSCKQCGNSFEKTRQSKKKYCSKNCRMKYIRENSYISGEKTCEFCGSKFTVTNLNANKRYCGTRCYKIVSTKREAKRKASFKSKILRTIGFDSFQKKSQLSSDEMDYGNVPANYLKLKVKYE